MTKIPLTINHDMDRVIGVIHLDEEQVPDLDFCTLSMGYVRQSEGNTELIEISIVPKGPAHND